MNLLENLGIRTESVSAQKVILSVKVTDKLKQPFGIVHGGINATLAETAASLGANQWLTDQRFSKVAIGLNVNTQHLFPVEAGVIKMVAHPIHCGRHIQTWEAQSYLGQRITSTSVVTLVNKEKKK